MSPPLQSELTPTQRVERASQQPLAQVSPGQQVLASLQRIEAVVRASRKETTDVLERIASALETIADRPTVVTAHYVRKPK